MMAAGYESLSAPPDLQTSQLDGADPAAGTSAECSLSLFFFSPAHSSGIIWPKSTDSFLPTVLTESTDATKGKK